LGQRIRILTGIPDPGKSTLDPDIAKYLDPDPDLVNIDTKDCSEASYLWVSERTLNVVCYRTGELDAAEYR
jgi:hypothetical protein